MITKKESKTIAGVTDSKKPTKNIGEKFKVAKKGIIGDKNACCFSIIAKR